MGIDSPASEPIPITLSFFIYLARKSVLTMTNQATNFNFTFFCYRSPPRIVKNSNRTKKTC
jgi:hypothetical protein